MALTDGLLHYYELQDNNSTETDSHGSFDLTVTGATYVSSGKLGGAYDFDGTDDVIGVSGTSISQIDEGSTFTISAWFNPDTLSPSTAAFDIVANTNDSASRIVLFVRDSNVRCSVYDGGSFHYSNMASVSLNTWYHVVVTHDSSNNMTLYLNGVEATTAASIQDNGGNTHFAIGAKRDGGGWRNEFKGMIDEVGIWNRELSSSEVSELYNSGNGLAYPLTTTTGWGNKIFGVTPNKVNGVGVSSIAKVNGV